MQRLAILAATALLAAAPALYAVPPAADSNGKSGDRRDQIVCRRFVRIGSLVDGYRTCKTRAEWDREHEDVRQLSVSDACRLRGEPSGAHSPDC